MPLRVDFRRREDHVVIPLRHREVREPRPLLLAVLLRNDEKRPVFVPGSEVDVSDLPPRKIEDVSRLHAEVLNELRRDLDYVERMPPAGYAGGKGFGSSKTLSSSLSQGDLAPSAINFIASGPRFVAHSRACDM